MVPSSYSGPRLPESGITLQFVLDLMETFQGQVRAVVHHAFGKMSASPWGVMLCAGQVAHQVLLDDAEAA